MVRGLLARSSTIIPNNYYFWFEYYLILGSKSHWDFWETDLQQLEILVTGCPDMIKPGTKTCPEQYVYFLNNFFYTYFVRKVLKGGPHSFFGAKFRSFVPSNNTMSDRVAETMKYCCFSRSSFPFKKLQR